MTVKIEMDMPISCYECRFYQHSYNVVFEQAIDTCLADRSDTMFDPSKGRPDWCPLKKGE